MDKNAAVLNLMHRGLRAKLFPNFEVFEAAWGILEKFGAKIEFSELKPLKCGSCRRRGGRKKGVMRATSYPSGTLFFSRSVSIAYRY